MTTSKFEIREGDTLTVTYTGAKLQIAPFTTVEIDSSTYRRTLQAGDDPEHEFARIYAYLKNNCELRARAKLETYAAELAKAKSKAKGE
jgi:hypothetical protein